MSSTPLIELGEVIEDSPVVAMARLIGAGGSYVTQSQISSIQVKVFDLAGDLVTPTYTDAAISVASSIFDTLQTTDLRWTKDTTGYNFRHTVPASALPTDSHYRIEYKFTPASGDAFFVLFEVQAAPVYTS